MTIKSALEIALEKTKDLKVDKDAIVQKEARETGMRLAGEYLNDPEVMDFSKSFQEIPKDRRNAARAGAFDVFTSRIQLPTSAIANPESELAPLAVGLKALNTAPFGEKKIQELFSQLGGFLNQYLADAKKVEEAIRQQFAPRLKQKEQELSMRMGRAVRIDPMDDPDFAEFYKHNVGQMKEQYQGALDKAKSDLAKLCGVGGE